MIHVAEVFMWGTRIGILHKPADRPFVSFEYDRNFQRSGIELSPIHMPLSGRLYEFPALADDAFHGVPGMIADSLPDRFGNAVISQWLASQGKSNADFNVLDRLCYTGARGMGALEYSPATGPAPDKDDRIQVDAMVEFASDILNNRGHIRFQMSEDLTYSQLLQLGTSAGGARAKAILAWNPETNEIRSGQINAGPGFEYWLMKFDGVSKNGDHGVHDAPQYTRIEYAYYLMATAAGIKMNPCRLYQENGRYHFMTKRFDRVNGRKLHMQTLGALAHINYNIPGLCSYEQAADYMRQLNLPASDIEQFYRRMVFNVLAVNQDDHVKNVSFLMDRTGTWNLSPAYDMTFSYSADNMWLSYHQMTVSGKRNGITEEDLIAAGRSMDISTRKCRSILGCVREAVTHWPDYAAQAEVSEEKAMQVAELIRRFGTFGD